MSYSTGVVASLHSALMATCTHNYAPAVLVLHVCIYLFYITTLDPPKLKIHICYMKYDLYWYTGALAYVYVGGMVSDDGKTHECRMVSAEVRYVFTYVYMYLYLRTPDPQKGALTAEGQKSS